VNRRDPAEREQLIPIVVEQAIATSERYLLAENDPARQSPP
jgi:hypothetical protein